MLKTTAARATAATVAAVAVVAAGTAVVLNDDTTEIAPAAATTDTHEAHLPTDQTAPTRPPTFTTKTTAPFTESVDLKWGRSTDNVGVRGYLILIDGELVHRTKGNVFVHALGWKCQTIGTAETHTVGVSAVDAAGNMSLVNTLTVTIPCTGPGA
jgi:hypothetical protein